jgi:hypothetical protein
MATQNGALPPVWDDFDRWGSTCSKTTSELQLTMHVYLQTAWPAVHDGL